MKANIWMLTGVFMAALAALVWLLFHPSEFRSVTLPGRRPAR